MLNSAILTKVKSVTDCVIYEKITTVNLAACSDELTDGKMIGLTARNSLYVRRVLLEMTTAIQQVINIVGVCSFFISNFGSTFALILIVVGVVRVAENYLNEVRMREVRKQHDNEDTQNDLMSELFGNIRMLKLYALENWFKQKVYRTRETEVKLSKKQVRLYVLIDCVSSLARSLIPVVTFSMFIGMGNELELSTVIIAQEYFFRLAPIIETLPRMWQSYKDIKKGLSKIDEFL